MFKRKEKQSLLEARTNALKKAEELIKKLYKRINIVEINNAKILESSNKKIDLFNTIIKELYSNVKTDKQKVAKIKELINDYQLKNQIKL